MLQRLPFILCNTCFQPHMQCGQHVKGAALEPPARLPTLAAACCRYYDKLVHNLDDRAKQQHWHRPWLGEFAASVSGFGGVLQGLLLPVLSWRCCCFSCLKLWLLTKRHRSSDTARACLPWHGTEVTFSQAARASPQVLPPDLHAWLLPMLRAAVQSPWRLMNSCWMCCPWTPTTGTWTFWPHQGASWSAVSVRRHTCASTDRGAERAAAVRPVSMQHGLWMLVCAAAWDGPCIHTPCTLYLVWCLVTLPVFAEPQAVRGPLMVIKGVLPNRSQDLDSERYSHGYLVKGTLMGP